MKKYVFFSKLESDFGVRKRQLQAWVSAGLLKKGPGLDVVPVSGVGELLYCYQSVETLIRRMAENGALPATATVDE